MKNDLTRFIALTILASSFLSACKKDEVVNPVNNQQINTADHRTGLATCGNSTVVNLIAGQHIPAGTVTVTNTATDLLVTYTTTNGWYIKELHLYAGACAMIPANNSGNPIPGHFPYSNSFSGTGTITHTYSIPLSRLPACYCIAAHAVVSKPGAGIQTAWGQGTRIVSKGNWAMKFEYCTQRCEPVPDGCSFYPNPLISSPGAVWPTATVTVGGFVYTQAQANAIYNQPTTDARVAFIYIAAMRLSLGTGNLSPSADVWADVATVEAWLSTVGKLSPSNLPNAPATVLSAIGNISNWAVNHQCE